VTPAPESGDKLTRFGPFSSQCRAGNVKIRRGAWNEELFRVLEGFPELAHDDEVDACSGALEMLNPGMKSRGFYEWARQKAEALKEQHKPQPPQHQWAIGSMEWEAEQRKKEAELAAAAGAKIVTSVHLIRTATAYCTEQEEHTGRQSAEIKHGHVVDYPHIIGVLIAE
jgi:hypothetical protein